MTKVTDFNPNGLPLPLGGWSTGYTSIGSNTDSNPPLSALNFVQRITSNTSNTLLNPIVNFASGSGVSLAAASNTITISATGGGGGGSSGITVQDEGTPLATSATTLNFVGSAVAATGAGATKTITVTGASLPWYDVTTYGATGNGSTDDTTSIQNAINACMTAGGGTVYFPPGIYQISGALQDTGTFNSQLEIPTASTYKAIRFLGWGPERIYGGTIGTPSPESIIRSDWNGTISGNPAIFSAGTYHSIGASKVYVSFQDLTIIAHDDPKLSALQMTAAANVRLQSVQIRTTTDDLSGGSVPTHSNAVAYDGPWGYGSIAAEDLWNVAITGFYTGMKPAEQTHGGTLAFAFCAQAMEFVGNQGGPTLTLWPNYFTHVTIVYCVRGLVFSNDVRWVSIGALAFEHDPGNFAAVYDIDDASNYGRGFLNIHAVTNGGPIADPIYNGGTGLSLHQASSKYWKLNSQIEIPTGTDPSTNAATGGKLYAASATGHPTWRDSAGTVTDLLSSTYTLTIKDEGGSLSTGATSIDFVGAGVTASGTGAAKTVTIPSGGVGAILIADTHSTPLIFADLLQTEAQDDLLYADT